MFFRILARARSTSSFVGGIGHDAVDRLEHRGPGLLERLLLADLGPEEEEPGSFRSRKKLETRVAFFVSTSALWRRPEGVSPRTSARISTAAASGCEPAGTWYATASACTSPTRRSVTERSPSCVGSAV